MFLAKYLIGKRYDPDLVLRFEEDWGCQVDNVEESLRSGLKVFRSMYSHLMCVRRSFATSSIFPTCMLYMAFPTYV